jgi:asparagine synthase (glutamine-hydrolysing)
MASGDARVGAAAPRGDVFASPPERLLVVFDGRLDDRAELAQSLGVEGSARPARIVAAAYLKWGDRLATILRGDFALVIWDGAQARVLAARDPFGVRPLHWTSRGGRLYVASDADQFLTAGIVGPSPDERMVREFLDRRFRTLHRSYFAGVSRVLPGHVLVATPENIRTWDYRSVPTVPLRFASQGECHEAFRALFSRAVARRLDPDAPNVIQISGGVDSAAIACVADQVFRDQRSRVGALTGASAVFPGLPCDEAEHIDVVARHLSFPVERWNGTIVSDVEFREPLLAAPGARIPWASGTEGYIEIARSRGARTILDGTGGDQVGMPLGLERDEVAPTDWRVVAQYLRQSPMSLPRATRVLKWLITATAPLKVRKLRGDLRKTPPEPVPQGVEYLPADHRFISWRHALRWRTLAGAQLASAIDSKQRHAALFGLDVTFPFLDWDVILFVLALPLAYWPRRSWLARLHREALRSQLPPGTYGRRSKAEFTSAMLNRTRSNITSITSILEEGAWESGPMADRREAQGLLTRVTIDGDGDGAFDAAHRLWAIASVEAWRRKISRYHVV